MGRLDEADVLVLNHISFGLNLTFARHTRSKISRDDSEFIRENW